MSFTERFDSSEPIEPIDCIYGPPWCGKCKPEHCLFFMEYAFIPSDSATPDGAVSDNMTNTGKEK